MTIHDNPNGPCECGATHTPGDYEKLMEYEKEMMKREEKDNTLENIQMNLAKISLSLQDIAAVMKTTWKI